MCITQISLQRILRIGIVRDSIVSINTESIEAPQVFLLAGNQSTAAHGGPVQARRHMHVLHGSNLQARRSVLEVHGKEWMTNFPLVFVDPMSVKSVQ